MAKRKVEIPKGSWLDMKGKRWMTVAIDVMIEGGKFLRQITMTFPVNFEMALGKYMVDMGDMNDFRDSGWLRKRYGCPADADDTPCAHPLLLYHPTYA